MTSSYHDLAENAKRYPPHIPHTEACMHTRLHTHMTHTGMHMHAHCIHMCTHTQAMRVDAKSSAKLKDRRLI
jgi:hypothetical protein